MKNYLIILTVLTFSFGFSQNDSIMESEVSVNKFIDGTLTTPASTEHPDLVILIQGSGPTDRNGNGFMMKNDGSKIIARELAKNGIASYRFDKRIFKMNKYKIREEELSFEDFIEDVSAILDHFKAQDSFENIIIAGHSEGSLIGMIAAANKADAFISLAGPGRSIDKIVIDQLAKQSPELSENAKDAFQEIQERGKTSNYSPLLQSIFRPSVQPFLKSWMKYDPREEIAKLDMPILIINGSFDIQVDTTEANLLTEANPKAELVILDKMNHIFRKIEGDDLENTKAYNEPNRPLHPELIPNLVDFIKSVK
ncbi:alpha/beta hydrolase [Gillisia marina]|uniref:alpha/beta hydrolase n=1 Tax=Gillisia marina TaxID=1167637 RepID=UPI000299DF89|nr:alpha/beta hydrolase [Gillisia marina]